MEEPVTLLFPGNRKPTCTYSDRTAQDTEAAEAPSGRIRAESKAGFQDRLLNENRTRASARFLTNGEPCLWGPAGCGARVGWAHPSAPSGPGETAVCPHIRWSSTRARLCARPRRLLHARSLPAEAAPREGSPARGSARHSSAERAEGW